MTCGDLQRHLSSVSPWKRPGHQVDDHDKMKLPPRYQSVSLIASSILQANGKRGLFEMKDKWNNIFSIERAT